MGKIFKSILITAIKVMKFYNSVKKTFKSLFTNEKSN